MRRYPWEADRPKLGACWDSGGGGGPQQVTQTSKSEPPAYLQPYLTDIAQKAQANYNSNQPQYFPGQTYQSPSAATNQSIAGTIDRAQAGNPLLPAAQGQTLSMIRGDYLNPNSNPFLRASVDAANQPVVDNYMQNVAPSIDARFSMAGRYGSPGAHVGAQGQALDSLNRTLANNSATMYGNAYNTERGYQNAAIAAAPQLAETDYNDLTRLAAAGATQEGYDTAKRNADIARWDYNQNLPTAKLGQYSNLIYGQNAGGTNTTTSQIPMTGGNPLLQYGGMGLSALGTFGSLFGAMGPFAGVLSDRRAKTDIKKVGETEGGTNIYTYRYKADPTRTVQMGVMAQEVARKNPLAVQPVNGLLTVDYSRVA